MFGPSAYEMISFSEKILKEDAELKKQRKIKELRDEFAARAMQGLLAYGWKTEENVAPKAYAMADAMMAEREKRQK